MNNGQKVTWYGTPGVVLSCVRPAKYEIQTEDGATHQVYESDLVKVDGGYDVTTGNPSNIFEV